MKTRRRGGENLLAALAIPMTITQWNPVSVSSHEIPKITVSGTSWHVETHSGAGGYAYFLPEPLSLKNGPVRLSWKWKVTQFPDTHPTPPLDKKNDDYALRIGILLSDGDSAIRVPPQISRALRERNRSLSYVLFYCASRSPAQQCGINPYSAQVINCLKPSGPELSSQTAFPINDALRELRLPATERERLRIIGVWVFADSDNSHSNSDAVLENLEFSQ